MAYSIDFHFAIRWFFIGNFAKRGREFYLHFILTRDVRGFTKSIIS